MKYYYIPRMGKGFAIYCGPARNIHHGQVYRRLYCSNADELNRGKFHRVFPTLLSEDELQMEISKLKLAREITRDEYQEMKFLEGI